MSMRTYEQKIDFLAHYLGAVSERVWSADSKEMAELHQMQAKVYMAERERIGIRAAHEESIRVILRQVLFGDRSNCVYCQGQYSGVCIEIQPHDNLGRPGRFHQSKEGGFLYPCDAKW